MRSDVIILGGGIIGCALAEELARRGRRVIVLDQSRIGAEASSAAAGILAAQMDLPAPGPFFELCQEARRMYPGWVTRLRRRSGRTLSLHVDGILYVAKSRREESRMASRVRWQRARGLQAERWTAAQVRRREPAVDGAFRCGFYFPTEAQLDNVRLMEVLTLACRKSGVRLYEGVTVRRVVVRRRAVQGVETERGRFRAPVVVNCLGSWANMEGRFPVRVPVEPARGQMLAFDGPPRLLRHVVMSEDAYAVQRRDGRILVGSTIERVGFQKALTLEGMHDILCGVRQLSSRLLACEFLKAWAGFRPYSATGAPLLGPTSIAGLYLATGHFRHGILLAPVTAALMAELILRGRSPTDLSPFSLRT